MKKILSLVLSSVMALGILAGCGSKTNATVETPGNSETPVASTEEVTIRVQWWGGDDRHEATLNAIKEFEATHPLIKVKAEYGGWDGHKDKVTTMIAGNTAPDVMQINYDWISTFSADGKGFYDLRSLSEHIKLDNWSDDVLKFGEINGVLNAIAVSVTGRSAFYNKTTYDAMGVAIPKTWDELIAAGKAFEAKDPTKYAFDLDTGSGFTGLYMALAYEAQKTGKEFITADGKLGFTEAEILDAFNFYLSLEKNHVIRTQKDRMNDSGEDALYQTEKFINGSVAGVLEWSSSIGKFEKVLTENPNPQELVLGELLVMDGAKNSGWMQKPSLLFAINGKTEHPVESAIFLDWLLNDKEASKLLGSSRGIPSSAAALAALEGTPALEGLSFNATKQIADSKPLLISPYLENSSLKEVYKVAIEDISYGSKTPEDAAKYFVEQVSKILTEIVK